jgi:2-iminobutanoate/2-iminopropanoate deaminase
VGVDPSIGAVPHDFAEEVETAMANLERLLESSDSGLDLVVKMTCYVADIELAPVLNEIYARRMPQPRTARATVEVRMVPPYRVEIECVAGRRR